MKKQKGKVIFIRKNGRIIPIRINKDRNRQKKGAALTVTGGLLSIAGGRQTAKSIKKAKEAKEAAKAVRGSMNIAGGLNPKMAQKFKMASDKFNAKQHNIFKKSMKKAKRLNFASRSLGSFLIGSGFAQILRDKEDTVAQEVAKDAAATVAAGAVGFGISSKQAGRLSGSGSALLKKLFRKAVFRK